MVSRRVVTRSCDMCGRTPAEFFRITADRVTHEVDLCMTHAAPLRDIMERSSRNCHTEGSALQAEKSKGRDDGGDSQSRPRRSRMKLTTLAEIEAQKRSSE